MYLSKLTLNPHPSARAVLRDLADAYEMHRTIARGCPNGGGAEANRVLYRVERPREPLQPPIILVQSGLEPDWSVLADQGGYLLDHCTKELRIALSAGQLLRFRLRANPTLKRDGKRVPLVGEPALRDWLARKAQGGGFVLEHVAIVRTGRIIGHKNGRQTIVHDCADFDGLLRVLDAEHLVATVEGGIGPAKAFGCGLLSLAPPP